MHHISQRETQAQEAFCENIEYRPTTTASIVLYIVIIRWLYVANAAAKVALQTLTFYKSDLPGALEQEMEHSQNSSADESFAQYISSVSHRFRAVFSL